MEIKNNPNFVENKPVLGYDLYTKPIVPYLSENHLDIGCGTGEITYYFSILKPDINIIGFDPDEASVKIAKKSFDNTKRVSFLSQKEDLNDKKFDSASSVFAYHEAGKDIFETAAKVLKSGSFFAVVDYDLKDIGLTKFQQVFNSIGEQKEVEQMGWVDACLLHTKRGLKQCIESSENNGFKTIDSKKLNDKYFLWIGEKI